MAGVPASLANICRMTMLTFVLGQPPLVMFALLIFFGVLAQVVGDIARLVLYQRGS